MYSNMRGCDGERVYYYGGSMIAVNGEVVVRGEEFALKDVVSSQFSCDYEIIRLSIIIANV